jgi:transglutaminase-like putative cysteine protease
MFDHSREISEPIPPRALFLLALGLTLASLPFLGQVPVLAHLLVVALAFWRCRIQVTGGKLPAVWVRWVFIIGAVFLGIMFFGSLLNMQAASFLLLILVGLKLLELRNQRDFGLVVYLCTFLLLAALFFHSSLPLFIYQMLVLLIILSSLLLLQAGRSGEITWRAAYGRCAVLLVQALPLVVVFYLFFPRFSGIFSSPLAARQGATGMSNSMNPGEFAGLARNEDPVMRVSFPQETRMPRQSDRYWRGVVLWECDAFAWTRGQWSQHFAENLTPHKLVAPPEARNTLQRIILEPHNGKWIFALDRPMTKPRAGWGHEASMRNGQYLELRRGTVSAPRQYDVRSAISPVSGYQSYTQEITARTRGLSLESEPTPAIRELAWELSREHFDARGFLRVGLDYVATARQEEPVDDMVLEQLASTYSQAPTTPGELMEQALRRLRQEGWGESSNEERRRLSIQVPRWAMENTRAQAVVEDTLTWFQENRFAYTISPGAYSSGWPGVEEFLFEERRGFCEHFSGAFAALMRLSNVPSRVVGGYQGGQFNRLGNHLLVRQSDAHAWTEVWMGREGNGWLRVDPVNEVAPDRIDFGMEAWTEIERVGPRSTSDRVAAINSFNAPGGLKTFLRNIEFAWDAADYYWNVYVLSYDNVSQEMMFDFLGLKDMNRWKLFIMLVIIIFLLIISLLIFLQFRGRDPDPTGLEKDYGRFRRKLGQAGISEARSPTLGPLELRRAAVNRFPHMKETLEQISRVYITAVYSPQSVPDQDLKAWRKSIRGLKVRDLEE